jgi:hypothetical protein
VPTEPLTGSRYPDSSAAPNVPQDIQNAVFDLADNTIPHFGSTAVRDAAYASWVANGGAMRNSLFCAVGTTLYQYRSGAWEVVPTAYETRMMRAQRNVDTQSFPNNTWSNFSSDTNWSESDPWGMRSTGGTLVAVWTGWYQINATIWWNNNATGVRALALQPDAGTNVGEGAGQRLDLARVNATSGGFDTVVSGSHLTSLTAGNTVQIAGFQNSGAGLTVNAVRFSAAYLGPNT